MGNYFNEQFIRVSNTLKGECSVVRILLVGIVPAYISTAGEPDIRRISEEAAIRLSRLGAGSIELEVKKSSVIKNGKAMQAVQFKAIVRDIDPKTEQYYISISEQLAKMFCQPGLGRATLTFNNKLYAQDVSFQQP